VGKRRRGTLAEREAKDKLLDIFLQNPDTRDYRLDPKDAYDWVKQEHPDITKVLSYRQVVGVYSQLNNPLYRDKILGSKVDEEKPPTQPKGSKEEVEKEGGNQPTKADGSSERTRNDLARAPTLPTSPKVQRETQKYNTLGGEGYPPEIGEEGVRIVERELWVKATPIIRKIVLNPKIYLYYDYVRMNYGYKGDLGDFLYDAVEDFFKSRGITIKIVKEEDVA